MYAYGSYIAKVENGKNPIYTLLRVFELNPFVRGCYAICYVMSTNI